MAKGVGTGSMFELIIGGIIVVYMLAATWGGIQTQMNTINTSGTGGALIVLVPLILAGGVIYLVYKSYIK